MDILGAISGSRLRRERYDKEIQRERDNAVFAAAIDPNSAMTPEARERVFADYGKSYVDPKDPQSQYHYDRVVSAARSARMHKEKPPPPPSAVNPAAMAQSSAPTPNGGLTNPDTSGFSYALLRPPAQPQSNILFSNPFAAQKKNSDAIEPSSGQTPISAAAPAVTLRDAATPDWSNPSPTSTVASPGMNSIAPTNTPIETSLPAPFRWTRTDTEMGTAKAARELPLKRGEYEAMYGAQYDLYNKKFKEITKWIDERNKQDPDSDIEYTMDMGANGMPILKMDRGANVGQPVTGNLVPSNAKIVGGGPRDGTMTYQLRTYGNGSVKAFPISPILRQGFTTDAAGNPVPVQANPRLAGSVAAAGFKPLSTFNPRLFNTGTGVALASANQIAAGGLPAPIPGTIGAGAPTTSVLNVPGNLPQTMTRTRGASIAPTLTAQRGISNPSTAAATDNSPIAVNYRNWVAGQATLNDKEQTAARQYAAYHGLPTPNILSPGAQRTIAAINPILEEIVHARKLLKDSGLIDKPELESKVDMAKAYAKYKLGFTDPLTKAISDLSFDRIRSVGQALQGTGTRALPIFNLGLEHTPVIGINADSGKMMDNKLEGMERRARESIAAMMAETKSGVVPSGGMTPPASQPSIIHWGRDAQGNPVRLVQ